jgi:RNA polymerase sigma factor (sigma-70 family)
MNWINKIATHHQEYIETVQRFGETTYAEDIVQEAYIKIIKYCKEEQLIDSEGNVKKGYMYFVLRNLFLDFKKHKDNKNKVDISVLDYLGKNLDTTLEDMRRDEALDRIFSKVADTVSEFHWYDAMLFKLYKDTGKSMRTLSKETGISTSSIFTTLKNCKERIRENCGEDYQDYLNEDYELIN